MSPEEEREAAVRRLDRLRGLGWQPEAMDEFLGLAPGTTARVKADMTRAESERGG